MWLTRSSLWPTLTPAEREQISTWLSGAARADTPDKDNPNLQLIRLDPDRAQIWLNEHSLFAGVKLLLGSDPKKDYKDKMADVKLNRARH